MKGSKGLCKQEYKLYMLFYIILDNVNQDLKNKHTLCNAVAYISYRHLNICNDL